MVTPMDTTTILGIVLICTIGLTFILCIVHKYQYNKYKCKNRIVPHCPLDMTSNLVQIVIDAHSQKCNDKIIHSNN